MDLCWGERPWTPEIHLSLKYKTTYTCNERKSFWNLTEYGSLRIKRSIQERKDCRIYQGQIKDWWRSRNPENWELLTLSWVHPLNFLERDWWPISKKRWKLSKILNWKRVTWKTSSYELRGRFIWIHLRCETFPGVQQNTTLKWKKSFIILLWNILLEWTRPNLSI